MDRTHTEERKRSHRKGGLGLELAWGNGGEGDLDIDGEEPSTVRH